MLDRVPDKSKNVKPQAPVLFQGRPWQGKPSSLAEANVLQAGSSHWCRQRVQHLLQGESSHSDECANNAVADV